MKRKNNSLSKIGVVFLVSIMALTAIGAGYSAWFDTITITGTVSTGSVEWKFVDYSGTWVWKDFDDTDPLNGLECVVTADPAVQHDILVAYAEAVQGSTDHEAIVTYYNLFPCIDFAADVVILYTGTIPGKINDVGFYDLDNNPNNFWPDDADEVAIDQHTTLTIDIYDENDVLIADDIDPELLYGYQLHLGYRIHIVMIIHLLQDNTLMNLNGEFGVYAEVVQWNEYTEPAEDITDDWILRFHLGGGTWDHDMTITSQDAAGNIQGVGGYPAGGPYSHAWTLTGLVTGNQIQFTIIYQTGNPGYTVWATGTISPGGTYMSGTWTSSAGQQGTWETL